MVISCLRISRAMDSLVGPLFLLKGLSSKQPRKVVRETSQKIEESLKRSWLAWKSRASLSTMCNRLLDCHASV